MDSLEVQGCSFWFCVIPLHFFICSVFNLEELLRTDQMVSGTCLLPCEKQGSCFETLQGAAEVKLRLRVGKTVLGEVGGIAAV
jgi:hypothetical protein